MHGILAVYSTRPREWREEEADALDALAATAAAARVNAELYQGVSHEQQRSEAILANVADGIVAVDRDGKVVSGTRPPSASPASRRRRPSARHRPKRWAVSLDAAGGSPGGSRLCRSAGAAEVWLSLSEAVMTDPPAPLPGASTPSGTSRPSGASSR